jgi:uncharacterized protein (DUF1697 family)
VAKGVRRVALLRGINVGGAGTLKMADLRKIGESLGFAEVKTAGASGNLLYTSARAAAADAQALEEALARKMGRGKVAVRDGTQMQKVVKAAPWSKPDPGIPDKWRFVAFLRERSARPLPDVAPGIGIRFAGRTPTEVFYTMRDPTSAAIAMAGRVEKTLGTSITVRNWNVVRLLAERLTAPPSPDV